MIRGTKQKHVGLLRLMVQRAMASERTKASPTAATVVVQSPQTPAENVAQPPLGPAVSIPQDQLKVSLQKPVMDVTVDTTTISEPEPRSVLDPISSAVSFDDIPGPISLRILSKIWNTIPLIGTQVTGGAIQYFLSIGSQLSWYGNMALFRRFFDHYGPVVRLHGPFGGDVVMLMRPEHMATVFRNEGRYPIRSTLDSVEKYRLQHRKYKNCGPFLMYPGAKIYVDTDRFGPEWEKFRKSVEQPLQSTISQQYGKIEDASDKFLVRIANIRDRQDQVPATFYKEINKWCLECFCVVTLNKRMGFLDPCGLSSTSDPGQLLEGLAKATKAIQRCELGLHLWKFVSTPAWNSLVYHCDTIDNIFSKYIQRVHSNLREKKESGSNTNVGSSLLENMLLKNVLTVDDAMTIMLDMMLIGVNAVSHTVAFLLYHLAKYPRCQAKLYNEIQRQPSKMNKDMLASMPYLQACIKESLRLKPPVPVLGRVLQDHINVYNYHIPKGTYLLMITSLTSLREEYFEDAHKFKPERWLNNSEDIQGFASIPFGYGAKACFAKELAEMQVGILITKVLQKYKVEYLYGDIHSSNKLLASPTKNLKFRFVGRL